MHIHYLQHVEFENAGFIETWAKENNHTLSKTQLFADQELPSSDNFDILVVMGGPMNIYQYGKYPWLKREKTFIKECIYQNKKILGICLGAQLIADVLGAKTTKNKQKEIGWFECEKIKSNSFLDEVLPDKFLALHWHGDTFAIPENAAPLAKTPACANQGFIYNNNVIGLQFHLEATYASLSSLIKHCKDEIDDSKYMQSPQKMLEDEIYFTKSNTLIKKIMEFLATA